jgi:hypothetical protein
MAQKPSPTPKPSAAKAAPAAKQPPSGSRARKFLLWGGVGVVSVLLGLAVAWYFLVSPGGSGEGGPLRIVKDFLPSGKPATDKGGKPGAVPGVEQRHTVKSGENLWSIAKQGDLVSNPWEWRTILVQNKDKISYAFISEEDGAWKVMVDEGKELKVRSPGYNPDGVTGKHYAVQVLTVPQSRLKYATEVVKSLLSDGQYAYLYRRDFGGKSWYRIRAGFFATPEEAQEAGEYILARHADKKMFKEYWVTLPSQRELRGELIEFGAQQVKPWVVELPERDTQGKALEDLRALSTETDFVYISQRKDKDSGKFAYRTRIGFFGSEKTAQDFIAKKKGGIALVAEGKARKVETFEETLPGQNLRLGKPVPGEPYTEPPPNHDKPTGAKVTAPPASTPTPPPVKGAAGAKQ